MSFFEKKVKIYEAKGRKEDWKNLRAALKEAGIRRISVYVWQDEPPVCGCGAKLDIRDFGEGGKIDRDIYSIRVPEGSQAQAEEIVKRMFPDYTPYERRVI